MTKDEFFATVTPALITFMSVVVPALLAWLTNIIRQWANKQAEAKDREALHSAMQTGAAAAEQKFAKGGTAVDKAAFVVDYVQKSVPDAIKNLNPSAEILAKLAMSKQLAETEKEPC
jgi:hypothetical protein